MTESGRSPRILARELYDDKSFDAYELREELEQSVRWVNRKLLKTPLGSGDNTLLGRDNISLIALATKQTNGVLTDEAAVVLFVVEKAPLELVQFEYQAAEIGREFFDDKIATDVFVVGKLNPNY